MLDFLKLASKSTWGIFFYFGTFCIVAAATGYFVFKSDSTPVNQQLALPVFLLGVVLITYSMYREWETNRPPRPVDPDPDPADYKVEVTSPSFNARVMPDENGAVEITGKVKRDPTLDGLELWYFTTGSLPRVWPTRVIVKDKKWSLEHRPGDYKQGDRRLFRFCVVGKNGQALFTAYRDINEALKKSDRGYEPLRILTDDVYTCAEHVILLKKEAAP
jgi:hypothetical protein